MSSPQLAAAHLEVRRTIAAKRETVFRAWTVAEELKRWFVPSAEYTCNVPVFELREGGAYRIEMHHKSGRVSVVTGTYREIVPPERLVFTWQWESKPDSEQTLVTVEFRAPEMLPKW